MRIPFITPSLFLCASIIASLQAQDHGEEHGSHAMHGVKTLSPTIKVVVLKMCDKDNKKVVHIKLLRTKDDTPVTLDALKEVHTQKIHLLIIDDTLADYTHVHPTPTNEPGVYTFDWCPKTHGNYRMWADLFSLDAGHQEYAMTDLTTKEDNKRSIDRTVFTETTLNGYSFKLSFDKTPLVAEKAVMGTIHITDSKGQSVKNLEPIMGAFAHIVGFSEDKNTVVHMHPMGEEPAKTTDRGGPDLHFHMAQTKPGFIKLFAQVVIDGKELFVPFGIHVS